ncbi:MAG: adenylate/guanylate cyclase domain-containing protein [Reichenbachiella sp.]|uniref:adenylate/guanylate cyclase domain-containing protein n=1 Tax=Reichenbachiella sp. TaxID=2184521 RepID=UPI0032670C4D
MMYNLKKSKYVKSIIRHFLIWTPAFVFWTVMRQFGHEIVQDDFTELTFFQQIRVHVALGVVAGILFGSLEYFYDKNILKRVAFGKAVLIGSVSYLIAIIILISMGMRIFAKILQVELNWEIYHEFMFSKEMILLVFYCFLVGFFIDFFKQIDKKFGPGNLWRMLKGEFYDPKEDERIFMFLDLKSSTTLAEKLGHIKYSRLLQDCFQDLSIVEKYEAEIYQYVGDEAVLTWKKEEGLANANCLRAFFDFRDLLSDRSEYYLQEYGVVPEFKAGLNMGKIIVAEVGEIKREIAYHGDAINTAARIQDQCNELGQNMLISESLQERLELNADFSSSHVGDILLKGKSIKVNIFSIEAA